MRRAMRRRWAARLVSSVIAAAASIPTPASSTAAISAPARTEPSVTWSAGSTRPVRGANAGGRRAQLQQCARTSANGVPTLPLVVPFVDHRYGRAAILDEPVVAVSLYELVNMATGKVDVASRGELAARFLIPEAAQVVVSGVDKDRPIERWWELKDRRPILAALKDLGVALTTTPMMLSPTCGAPITSMR